MLLSGAIRFSLDFRWYRLLRHRLPVQAAYRMEFGLVNGESSDLNISHIRASLCSHQLVSTPQFISSEHLTLTKSKLKHCECSPFTMHGVRRTLHWTWLVASFGRISTSRVVSLEYS